MDTSVVRQSARPTTPADLHRLAAQGKAKGVQLFQVQATGAWFATSVSSPGKLHALTGYSCDCCGFVAHGRCMHHSLLLARLGWLPEVQENFPERDVPASVDCAGCNGRGWNYFEVDGGRSFPGKEPCRRCNGCGQRPVRIVRHAGAAALAAD